MDQDCKKVVNRWEDMDTDILIRIFQKHFSIDELTSGLAHVCSGWRAACCNPVMWDTLELPYHRCIVFKDNVNFVFLDPRSDKDLTRLLKVSMNLSKGNIRTLIVHHNLFLTDEMLTYTAKRCPNLRRLVLPSWDRIINDTSLTDALNSCKKLESLTMPSLIDSHMFFSMLVKRRKFIELKVMGPIDLSFAESIVVYLPKLKVLSIRCITITEDALDKILDKLKHLEVLNLTHSFILEEQQRGMHEVMLKKERKLKQVLTCTEKKCAICEMVMNDQIIRWSKCERGLWKEDEVSSLHL